MGAEVARSGLRAETGASPERRSDSGKARPYGRGGSFASWCSGSPTRRSSVADKRGLVPSLARALRTRRQRLGLRRSASGEGSSARDRGRSRRAAAASTSRAAAARFEFAPPIPSRSVYCVLSAQVNTVHTSPGSAKRETRQRRCPGAVVPHEGARDRGRAKGDAWGKSRRARGPADLRDRPRSAMEPRRGLAVPEREGADRAVGRSFRRALRNPATVLHAAHVRRGPRHAAGFSSVQWGRPHAGSEAPPRNSRPSSRRC